MVVTRKFTCRDCGNQWETAQPGSFKYCPECKQRRTAEKGLGHEKVCRYAGCGKAFTDTTPRSSMRYCSVECRYKAKATRSGKKATGGFLSDQSRICGNPNCGVEYTPTKSNQMYCSLDCRQEVERAEKEAKRHKVCKHCQQPFYDDTEKNNRQAHPDCSNAHWGIKVSVPTEVTHSHRMERRRSRRVRDGDGGRIDQIETMTKFTTTWWGRVSELIYARYRPDAQDMNILHGNRSPYDFMDDTDRIEVRGSKCRASPQGRPMWTALTAGLPGSCDYLFWIGYDLGGGQIEYLWLIPTAHLPLSLCRMAPGSREYKGDQWDITDSWGTRWGQNKLQELRDLPEPVRPEKFSWMDDRANLPDHAAPYRGRQGELLYGSRYPDSLDVNRDQGSGAPYDFLDTDGIKVNVKSARVAYKGHSRKWSFTLCRPNRSFEHKCDVYSCLCLDGESQEIIHEYRIPAEAFGERRTIHIYETGKLWEQYRVRIQFSIQEAHGLLENFSPTTWQSLDPDEQDRWIGDIFKILRKTPFPYPALLHPDQLQVEYGKLQALTCALTEDGEIRPASRAGLKACYPYFPNRYEAARIGSISAYESWHRERDLKAAIRFQLKVGDPVVPYRVLRAITMQVRTPTLFRPGVAKYVYDTYGGGAGGRVYDPCMGYGGRMLGALAAGLSYVGTDVDLETVRGNKNLAADLGLSDRVGLHNLPAEEFTPPGAFDLVFTSPPYFSQEQYAGGSDQSWKRHGKTVEAWADGFLQPVFQRSAEMLKPGGYLVLNIADIRQGKKQIPLVQLTRDLAAQAGFTLECEIRMPLASLNKATPWEPVLVFCTPSV